MSKRKAASKSKPAVKFWRIPRVLVMTSGLFLVISVIALSWWQGVRVKLYSAPTVAPAHPASTNLKLAKEYIYAGGRLIAVDESAAKGSPPSSPGTAPSSFLATMQPTGQVALSWSPPAGSVDHYEIERRVSLNDSAPSSFTCVAMPCTDAAASASKVYLYRVRAVFIGGGTSDYSNQDLAATFPFTDDPLNKDGIKTFIKAKHFTELREAINAIRNAAELLPFDWSGTTPQSLGPQSRGLIYASHFNDLRNGLGEALSKLGLPTPQYPQVNRGDPVTYKPMQELRDLMR